MKTHIINLEPHDDIISTRDKMEWAKAGRILLVWPRRAKLLYRRIDLVLLKRHSDSLGSQLAFVTQDPDIRYHAPRLGIPIFRTLKRAQNIHWRLPRRFRDQESDDQENQIDHLQPDHIQSTEKLFTERPVRASEQLHPLTRVAFFTLGVLAFLSIAASLYPSAEIRLKPKQQVQTTTIDITADPHVEEINISGMVPARKVTVIVEGRGNLPVSGTIQLPDQPAIGYAQFTNLTDKPVLVPEGTTVRKQTQSHKRYAVTETGTVPAGPGKTLDLPIRAVSPGRGGNLEASNIDAIEGLLGTRLSVTNLRPIQYGTDRIEMAPTEADRQKLSAQLRVSLEKTALDELHSNLGQEDILISSSLVLLRTIEEKYQPVDTQPADRLSLNLRLEYEALVVLADDLHQLAKEVLEATKPPGFSPIQEFSEIKSISAPKLNNDGRAYWKIRAQRQLEAELTDPLAIQVSLGMEPEQAKILLKQIFPISEVPQISLMPSWWPRLPILPFRIVIVNANSSH